MSQQIQIQIQIQNAIIYSRSIWAEIYKNPWSQMAFMQIKVKNGKMEMNEMTNNGSTHFQTLVLHL